MSNLGQVTLLRDPRASPPPTEGREETRPDEKKATTRGELREGSTGARARCSALVRRRGRLKTERAPPAKLCGWEGHRGKTSRAPRSARFSKARHNVRGIARPHLSAVCPPSFDGSLELGFLHLSSAFTLCLL